MGTSIRTRDGSVSVAALMQKQDDMAGQAVPATIEEVRVWGRQNGVPSAGKDTLRKVNARRRHLQLPPFVLVRASTGGTLPEQGIQPEGAPVPLPQGPLLVSSEEELCDLIEHFDGMRTGIVTPEIAGWFLDRNHKNRPLSKRQVDVYRETLVAGRWQLTGETVVMSRQGILNDGQHRLLAVYESEVPALMDVRFGIDRAAFEVTGTGRRRTAGNVLAIADHPYASAQAAIARLLRIYDAGTMAKYRAQVDSDEILRIVEGEPTIALVAAKTQKLAFGPVRTGPFGFPLVVALRTAPEEKVFDFVDLVASGATSDETDAARRLHVKLRDMALSRKRPEQLDLCVLTIRAWNAWSEGRAVQPQVMRVTEADRTDAGFPKVARFSSSNGKQQRSAN